MNSRPQPRGAGLMDYLKAWPQYLLPQYLLSNLMHAVTRSRRRWWKNAFINWFVRRYQVDMTEAMEPAINAYTCFNDFFTRPLKPDARPVDHSRKCIACPVDGFVSQAGKIEGGRIFQAKGRDYSLQELLADDHEWIEKFANGHFATLYLSPKNYHRIHMPVAGRLLKVTYVPGQLFSVNPATARAIPRLFARNERVITYYETDAGPMAMILVGAIFVGSMETVWQGVITPPHGKRLQHWRYPSSTQDVLESTQDATNLSLNKGAEMGRFNMGSTVVLLFPENVVSWQNLDPGSPIKMGQAIATYL